MTDFTELEGLLNDGHARLCQGREYTCTCGYDDRVDAAIAALPALLASAKRADEAEKLLEEVRLSEAELEQACKDLDLKIEGLIARAEKAEARVRELEKALTILKTLYDTPVERIRRQDDSLYAEAMEIANRRLESPNV